MAMNDRDENGLPPPIGTLFVMIVYMLVLSGMWAFMYWGLLARQ